MPDESSDQSRRTRAVEVRAGLKGQYSDVYTAEALAAIEALAGLDYDREAVMASRMERRMSRHREHRRIAFLDADATIPRTSIKVQDARDGNFVGSEIPHDLQRQWIQGTGPAAKPHTTIERSIRNVAYALLSGADGWMFDGEDALGQTQTMALDNQRNLALALARDGLFLRAAEGVAADMNRWSRGFFGRDIVRDWRERLDFTTIIFRARGLHLEEMEKLRNASDRDVYDASKGTTLPIAGAIVEAYVKSELKAPWYIDLLNLNIDNSDFALALERIQAYLDGLASQGTRITENLDFASPVSPQE
jgi:hypothetical protein